MFGRRSHQRFDISPAREGVLRVLQDVVLHARSEDELIVVGRQAGVVGDLLTVELADDDSSSRIDTRVVESRPIVLDGTVRHRLRLAPVNGAGQDGRKVEDFMARVTVSHNHNEQ
jgi:hypothetical protein